MIVSPNSTGEPSPKSRSKLKTECDTQLTELRLKNITKSGWVQMYFEPLSKPKLSWSYIRPGLSLCFDFPMLIQMLTVHFE